MIGLFLRFSPFLWSLFKWGNGQKSRWGYLRTSFLFLNRFFWNSQHKGLLLRAFEWRGQIWPNTTTQCIFCTAQRTFCTVFSTFLFFKVENWFFVCWIEFKFCKHSYTLFFDIQGAHSAHFAIQKASEKDAYAENFRKIGWKTKKMCANIPIGFFVQCPFCGLL